jgi:hypothetical protein
VEEAINTMLKIIMNVGILSAVPDPSILGQPVLYFLMYPFPPRVLFVGAKKHLKYSAAI